MIISNERHLRMVLREYAVHYNGERPHCSLGLEAPAGPPARAAPPQSGRLVSRPVLGGLHHEYEWVVAYERMPDAILPPHARCSMRAWSLRVDGGCRIDAVVAPNT